MKYLLLLVFSISAVSSHAQSTQSIIKKLGNDPVFFIDSIQVEKSTLRKYQPAQIATVTVLKDSFAIILLGPAGKDGAVFIETKVFAKNKYWNYFKGRSDEYAKMVPTPESDSSAQYILDGRILTNNFEGSLSNMNDSTCKEIRVIEKKELQKEYAISDKLFGVIITSTQPGNNNSGNKKPKN